ncbi:hypothetical protein HELRODRAFT_156995 [Helobdella robusta]|uniref:Rap-GAP domain-containing protein n=1 Tax=Helobdella robusta TaxID=6412 RepID=T1EM47_HELRO|nr:hypothetical protein HELRODRAFT_156995 [Helobdella robusta]ESO04374.1 hypothetical protein HELRODRAFT_156995 [Helobdella robusta]
MIDSLKKNEKLVRELKHLDNQKCRETHKIALIYVGLNQEDKLSILSNKQGSPAYEAFLQALGWKVDLKSHMGFSGGLQANGSNGAFAPYNASSNNEIIFHVATMMPGDGEEEQLRKLRHLGNDEVHIIWSEHIREYRHGIIPTEFGDVLLIIYPLECGLYRVQIKQKSKNYYFGPLYDETVVDSIKLPGLIKHTAVNASRSLHLQENFYEP